jgi:DNA-binding transcriptional LysR family regulator
LLLETRSLLYFIAVAEEKGIGRAAQRLHITQPALTRQIHALEDEIGAPLFTRNQAGMEITAAGAALLRHARIIQAELAQAKLQVKHAEHKKRQSFDVGVYGSAIFTIIPQILGEFSRKNPHVELRLHNLRKDRQIDYLRQGKIQAAFDRFLPREPDLAYELARREHEQFWVALHKDHPLAAREVIHIDDLAEEPCVGSTSDVEMESKLAQIFGTTHRVMHRADDILTSLALVSCGLCITFAPPSAQSMNMPNVVYRPCPGLPMMPFDLVCMYRKDDHSVRLQEMLETVRALRSASENASSH